MKDIDKRLENILRRTEKLISLQSESNRKVSELESVNQQLISKIKGFEIEILRLKENNEQIVSEQKKINNQKKTGKIFFTYYMIHIGLIRQVNNFIFL